MEIVDANNKLTRQFSSFAVTPDFLQIAHRSRFHFLGLYSIFLKNRRLSYKIMPGGILKGSGKVFVTSAFHLSAQGFAHWRRKSYMMAIHTGIS